MLIVSKLFQFNAVLSFLLLCRVIMITAIKISNMPIPRRNENVSPKRKMPISTAVSGSRAPIIAVGVEPMYLAAYTIITNARIAGTTANQPT